MLIYGKQAVTEALQEGTAERVFAAHGLSPSTVRELQTLARRADAAFELVPRIQLDQTLKTTRHQGIAAELPDLEYADPEGGVFLLTLVYAVSSVLTTVVSGRISDRVGRRKVFIVVSGIVMAVASAALAVAPAWPVVVVGAVLLGAGFGVFTAVDYALMTEVLPTASDSGRDLGVINKVWPADTTEEFLRQVTDYARGFCPPNGAALAVGRIKRAVQSGMEMGLEQGLAFERELQAELFASADAKEGLNAYADKRKPQFRGR